MNAAQTDFVTAQVTLAPIPPLSGTKLCVPSVSAFPAPPFDAAIFPAGAKPIKTNVEWVRVTANNELTGQFTVVRGRNGTQPIPIEKGWQIVSLATELWLDDGFDVGFANPMIAQGDMIQGLAKGVSGRLAGNISTRRQYLSQIGDGVLARNSIWSDAARFNVRDFGALGNGIDDDTAAINRARVAMVANGGGDLYFPAGSYRTSGIPAITTVPSSISGDGMMVSTIVNTHATNPSVSTTGQSCGINNLKFTCSVSRAAGNPLFSFAGGGDPLIYLHNLQIRANGDGILSSQCVLNIDQTTVKCLQQGGVALWSKAAGLTANGSLFFTIAGTRPAVWVQGEATSISIANCGIAGCGPRVSKIPTSIASDAAKFTVTFTLAHTHAIGDWIIISGVTPSAYNGFWRVATVPTPTTLTVTSLLNPGAATITFTAGSFVVGQRYQIASVGTTNFIALGSPFNTVGTVFTATGVGTGTGTASGTVYSVPCSMLVDNELGSVNESQIIGTQFGASGYPIDAMSAGLYVDGRRGTGTIEGWILGDSYVDIGRLGVLLAGGSAAGGTTTSRWEISSVHIKGNNGGGGTPSTMLGQVWVEQCPAVTLMGVKNTQGDKDPDSIALLVYAAATGPRCDGLIVNGCELGICANWSGVASANLAKYGVVFEGAINFCSFTGNVIWGRTLPVLNVGAAISASTVVKSSNNTFFTGTVFPTTVVYVPYFSDDGNVPIGGIVPYAGTFANIPTNWAICDGTGGTVDLTDRFILGTVTEGDVGDVGGTAQHKHEAGTYGAAAQAFSGSAATASATAASPDLVAPDVTGTGVSPVTTANGSNAASAVTGKSADAEDGAGSTADVRPPWFKLAYIQRIA